jgi:hypothetical protein
LLVVAAVVVQHLPVEQEVHQEVELEVIELLVMDHLHYKDHLYF